MAFEAPITISSAIRSIERNEYLLPAIQREFVWSHRKIEWLFDSIMQGYPISSFLFWRVEKSTKADYKFLKEYKQRYGTHNKEFSTAHHMDFTAVLDGQQRLTSLYIGLCGSYAYRKPRLKEANTDVVYPTRHLYLNIETPLKNDEDGKIFEFKFLKETDIVPKQTSWFKVSEIYSLSNFADFNKYLRNHNTSNEFAQDSLATLHEVIHTKHIINFFLEKDQNIDKALNIFIRINSGGEKLNSSDLIMSFAVANWEKKDARREIHNLVDNVKNKGFSISKDFVLKTFLYLHSKDIRFKVTNFSKENAIEFEKEWVNIRDTILSVFDLIHSFKLNDFTLTSKNALIPIIYYLYHKKIYTDFHTKVAYSSDRIIIREWLHVILIKRVFGSTSDNVLTQIRRAFTSDISKAAVEFDTQKFPVDSINSNLKQDMGVMTSDGIVGVVTDVSRNFSSAMSLLHKDMKVNCQLKKDGSYGPLGWDGADYRFCQLIDIPTHAKIKQGDTVITSEFSRIFPEGIIVGTIESYERRRNESYYTVQVKLSADLKKVNHVYVIRNKFKNERDSLELQTQKQGDD